MAKDRKYQSFWSRQTRQQIFNFSASLVAGKWWLMTIVSLLCGLVTLIYTAFLVTPMYAATSELLALKSDIDITKVDQNVKVSKTLLKDFVELAKSGKTISYALNDVNMPLGYTEERILKNLTVRHNKDSNIISISVQDESAENAALLANKLTEGLQISINELLLNTSTSYTQLSSVFEKAVVSTTPVYPNIPLSVLVALLLGFAVTFLIVTATVLLNNDIVAPEQIKFLTKLETLGNVVMFQTKEEDLPSDYSEPYGEKEGLT